MHSFALTVSDRLLWSIQTCLLHQRRPHKLIMSDWPEWWRVLDVFGRAWPVTQTLEGLAAEHLYAAPSAERQNRCSAVSCSELMTVITSRIQTEILIYATWRICLLLDNRVTLWCHYSVHYGRPHSKRRDSAFLSFNVTDAQKTNHPERLLNA